MWLRKRGCWKVCVEALAFVTLVRLKVFQVAIAVGHLKVLRLRNHMKSFFASKIGKLPNFKSFLRWSLLFLLSKFEHLHRCSTNLKSLFNIPLELGCNWCGYVHLMFAWIKLLRANWSLEKELVRQILRLFFCFFRAHLRGAHFLILWRGNRWLFFYETWRLILLFMRVIKTIFRPRSRVVFNWRVSIGTDSSLLLCKDRIRTKLLRRSSGVIYIEDAGILHYKLLL